MTSVQPTVIEETSIIKSEPLSPPATPVPGASMPQLEDLMIVPKEEPAEPVQENDAASANINNSTAFEPDVTNATVTNAGFYFTQSNSGFLLNLKNVR